MKAPVSTGNVENVAHVLLLRTTQDFVKFELIYASPYVSQRVYEIMKQQAENAMYQFVRNSKQFSHLGSVRRTLYEYIAHDLLIAGGKFKRRRLEPDGKKTNMTLVTIPASQNIVKEFATLGEGYENHQLVKKNTYFRPKDGFEAVDSWKQEVAMFQHTVARRHDIKKLVHEVARYCDSSKFYFVVADEDIARNFKYQNIPPPANGTPVKLEEYVLWIPVPENI
jgi:hypothetical protein